MIAEFLLVSPGDHRFCKAASRDISSGVTRLLNVRVDQYSVEKSATQMELDGSAKRQPEPKDVQYIADWPVG